MFAHLLFLLNFTQKSIIVYAGITRRPTTTTVNLKLPMLSTSTNCEEIGISKSEETDGNLPLQLKRGELILADEWKQKTQLIKRSHTYSEIAFNSGTKSIKSDVIIKKIEESENSQDKNTELNGIVIENTSKPESIIIRTVQEIIQKSDSDDSNFSTDSACFPTTTTFIQKKRIKRIGMVVKQNKYSESECNGSIKTVSDTLVTNVKQHVSHGTTENRLTNKLREDSPKGNKAV